MILDRCQWQQWANRRRADLDVIKLNMTFASQALAKLHALEIDDDAAHVNPDGGAIAQGHPLGMSGARISVNAALKQSLTGGRFELIAPTTINIVCFRFRPAR